MQVENTRRGANGEVLRAEVPRSKRFFGNRYSRRQFFQALSAAGSFGAAVRRSGLPTAVAFREMQDFVREKRSEW